ncbi:hypothetical protein [uncultured Parasphingorhabdus sp.]|uniref:DUF6953 family protein n=1 Tax=uncultured Parasphingorhabdus sp. TaxID=2709694 RepID=UPI0030D917B0|tara:strand:- start:29865 stop:30125 length:261 start_codon:yes stop_codon:yes gene_type:complete
MTPQDAAQWMLAHLQKRKFIDQETAAWHFLKHAKELSYMNDNGNPAIDKRVLTEFRKLMPDNVVWSRSSRHWRFREKHDKPGRMQS